VRLGALTLALVAFALPLAAEAQQAGKVWRIGVLSGYSPDLDKRNLAALRDGLRDLGYVEGTNVIIEQRHGYARNEKFPELAAELVRLKVDIFVVHGFPAAIRAAEQASRTIPVVFVANPDPIGSGFAGSLARPGGRVSGLSDSHSDLLAKRLQLLREALPSISRVAVLHTATAVSLSQLRDTQAAAPALRLTALAVSIRGGPDPTDIDRAFTTIRRERAEALNVLGAAAGIHTTRVAELAVKSRILTIGTTRSGPERGYLMSYGANFQELYRRAATYVDKILKGTKPADLPIEQPTKFEFVINMKTARLLSLTVPQSLVLRADHVID